MKKFKDRNTSAVDKEGLPQSLVERPGVADHAPDLRRLWLASTAVWVVSLVVQVRTGEDGPFWRAVVNQAAGGLASAAFAVIVAAVIFDRLKNLAQRRADADREKRATEVRELQRRLWAEEYSMHYEQLVSLIVGQTVEIARQVYVSTRVTPVERALVARALGGPLLSMAVCEMEQPLLRLNFARTPSTSGITALREMSTLVQSSDTQLQYIAQFTPDLQATPERPSLDLIAAFLRDARADLPALRAAAERVWTSLQDLDRLHNAFVGDRLAPPELGMGDALYHGAVMLEAVADWAWEMEDPRALSPEDLDRGVLRASQIARRAVLLADHSAQLYERLILLNAFMNATYVNGMHFEAGKSFLMSLAADLDTQLDQVDRLLATDGSVADEVLVAARNRTFVNVEPADLVPEVYRGE